MDDLAAARIAEMGFDNPAIWREFTRTISEMEKLVWSDPLVKDDLTRSEGVRYLTRLIAGAIPMTMELADADYPQFFHFLSTRIHWGLPATDCHYEWAAVHGDHVYRIAGDRGTAKLFDIETRQGHFAHINEWKLFDRRSDFQVGPDNHVEIVLSRDKPADVPHSNWVQLAEGPGNIIFRQYYYDWLREQPARLNIQRVGATYPPPPLKKEQVASNLQLLSDWLRQAPARFQQVVNTYYTAPENSMIFDSIDFGWKDLQYGKGVYQCAEDEALIVEVRLPQAPYWSIQLCSHFWEARDFHLRQTSLNGHQAEIDADGLFRAVISHRDPGIANWLDAGGHERGLLAIRYYKADGAPIPTVRRVKLAQLRAALPASTPAITPEARQKSLRERAWSVRRRNSE